MEKPNTTNNSLNTRESLLRLGYNGFYKIPYPPQSLELEEDPTMKPRTIEKPKYCANIPKKETKTMHK
jgi:hypothetical protein